MRRRYRAESAEHFHRAQHADAGSSSIWHSVSRWSRLGRPGFSTISTRDSLVLFDLGDPEDLARRLEYVWAEPEKTSEIVGRGREVYQAHMWSREREVFLGLVAGLLSGSEMAR